MNALLSDVHTWHRRAERGAEKRHYDSAALAAGSAPWSRRYFQPRLKTKSKVWVIIEK